MGDMSALGRDLDDIQSSLASITSAQGLLCKEAREVENLCSAQPSFDRREDEVEELESARLHRDILASSRLSRGTSSKVADRLLLADQPRSAAPPTPSAPAPVASPHRLVHGSETSGPQRTPQRLERLAAAAIDDATTATASSTPTTGLDRGFQLNHYDFEGRHPASNSSESSQGGGLRRRDYLVGGVAAETGHDSTASSDYSSLNLTHDPILVPSSATAKTLASVDQFQHFQC